MDKEINCKLIERENAKGYKNLFVKTPNGTEFQIKYAFYNNKLAYKVHCEIANNK